MDRISQIKNELLMKGWADMVRVCRSSGLTVKDWCMNNGINIKTYYYRLKRVRNFICHHKPEHNTDNSLAKLFIQFTLKNFIQHISEHGFYAFHNVDCNRNERFSIETAVCHLVERLSRIAYTTFSAHHVKGVLKLLIRRPFQFLISSASVL